MRTFIAAVVAVGTLLCAHSQAETLDSIYQGDIDAAYTKIIQTEIGRAVCRQILGADPEALAYHLGVSKSGAEKMARLCGFSKPNRWVYATQPGDIRKLTLKTSQPRKYKVLVSQVNFPIESWTDPFSNTTVLVTPSLPIPHEQWIQILAHEMAVYFDSKVNPSHPDAGQIPELRQLRLKWTGVLNPLVAISNPLHGHALTFLRALQVETAILKELVERKIIRGDGLMDETQEHFVAPTCAHDCIKILIRRLRDSLISLGLPILAYSPYYRSLILNELPKLTLDWPISTRQRAQLVLNNLPVEFLRKQSGGDPVNDMKNVFYLTSIDYQKVVEVTQFLQNDLWPLEKESLFSAVLADDSATFLEYMKAPLLSGYNVGLSSGPRVRIRTGGVE